MNAPLFSQPQAPNDSLDFQLKSVYDHHNDFFWRKNQILYQKETVSEDQRWVFGIINPWPGSATSVLAVTLQSNSTVFILSFFMLIYRKEENLKQDMLEKEREKDIRVWVDPQRCSIYSIK